MHGLARAVRRGLANMKIQAYLTAAAVNLKRLAAAIAVLLSCCSLSSLDRAPPPDGRGLSVLRSLAKWAFASLIQVTSFMPPTRPVL